MSALLQSPNLFRGVRRMSEQEAVASIGRLAVSAVDAVGGLETLACVALRLAGLHGVEISLRNAGKLETFEFHDFTETCRGSATGLIAANAREWGRLRIFFEPKIKSVECPLRFARMLAQQIALMLNRLEVLTRNQAARAALKRLEQRLDARKAVSRAAGVLAETHRLRHTEATLLLLKQARESRCAPLSVARSIILDARDELTPTRF
jgi:hypothetical protein